MRRATRGMRRRTSPRLHARTSAGTSGSRPGAEVWSALRSAGQRRGHGASGRGRGVLKSERSGLLKSSCRSGVVGCARVGFAALSGRSSVNVIFSRRHSGIAAVRVPVDRGPAREGSAGAAVPASACSTRAGSSKNPSAAAARRSAGSGRLAASRARSARPAAAFDGRSGRRAPTSVIACARAGASGGRTLRSAGAGRAVWLLSPLAR